MFHVKHRPGVRGGGCRVGVRVQGQRPGEQPDGERDGVAEIGEGTAGEQREAEEGHGAGEVQPSPGAREPVGQNADGGRDAVADADVDDVGHAVRRTVVLDGHQEELLGGEGGDDVGGRDDHEPAQGAEPALDGGVEELEEHGVQGEGGRVLDPEGTADQGPYRVLDQLVDVAAVAVEQDVLDPVGRDHDDDTGDGDDEQPDVGSGRGAYPGPQGPGRLGLGVLDHAPMMPCTPVPRPAGGPGGAPVARWCGGPTPRRRG